MKINHQRLIVLLTMLGMLLCAVAFGQPPLPALATHADSSGGTNNIDGARAFALTNSPAPLYTNYFYLGANPSNAPLNVFVLLTTNGLDWRMYTNWDASNASPSSITVINAANYQALWGLWSWCIPVTNSANPNGP